MSMKTTSSDRAVEALGLPPSALGKTSLLRLAAAWRRLADVASSLRTPASGKTSFLRMADGGRRKATPTRLDFVRSGVRDAG
jgi:hypothetical protein